MTVPWLPDTDIQAWIGADKVDLTAAASLSQAASDALAAYLERDLNQSTTSDYYDSNGTNYILLNYWPVQSIGSVVFNGQVVVPAVPNAPGWRMDSLNKRKLIFTGVGKLQPGEMNIQIVNLLAGYDMSAGVGTATGLPGHVAQAVRLTASAIFNSQAADPNLASESTAGVFSGSFYSTGVGAVPPGARDLVLRERRAF